MLGQGWTYGINGSFGLVLTLVNHLQNLNLHYKGDNSYLFVIEKEIFNFKLDNQNVTFPAKFCVGNISNEFSATDSRELSLKQSCRHWGGGGVGVGGGLVQPPTIFSSKLIF